MTKPVATGFVVDDAIVVLENTSRHIEQGMDRFQAALLGAKEVGFTVLSISLSLIAVFIPLLFMGGQAGRLFREFAVTLSAAVMISLVVSLTTTPMMCAWLLDRNRQRVKKLHQPKGRFTRVTERAFDGLLHVYERALDWALDAKWTVMAVLCAVVALNVWLFVAVPKGFFPQQDSGQLNGIIRADPAVDTVVGFTGGSRAGGGFMFVNLKPKSQRKDGGQAVIARLRPQLAKVTGISLFLNPVQDLRMGGRSSNSTYQYTLKSDNQADLATWATKLAEAMKNEDALTDIDTDQSENGVESFVTIDRDAAARQGMTNKDVDNALYDAFGQRQVATIYDALNQYHVVMEAMPKFTQTPLSLKDVQVPGNGSNAAPARGAASAATTAATTAVSANPGSRDASTGATVNTSAHTMISLSTIAAFSEDAAR